MKVINWNSNLQSKRKTTKSDFWLPKKKTKRSYKNYKPLRTQMLSRNRQMSDWKQWWKVSSSQLMLSRVKRNKPMLDLTLSTGKLLIKLMKLLRWGGQSQLSESPASMIISTFSISAWSRKRSENLVSAKLLQHLAVCYKSNYLCHLNLAS